MTVRVKGAHFPTAVMLMGVRWSVASPLSSRHVEELMEERGVTVDHATVHRWVITESPQLETLRGRWGALPRERRHKAVCISSLLIPSTACSSPTAWPVGCRCVLSIAASAPITG